MPVRRWVHAFAIGLVCLASAAGALRAAGARPAAPPSGTIAGTVLRAQIWHDNLNEQHLWRFKADGTVRADYWLVENGANASDGFNEESDSGTWRLAAGGLCIRWHLMFEAETHCYRLTALRPGWVRFADTAGGPSFDAQLSR